MKNTTRYLVTGSLLASTLLVAGSALAKSSDTPGFNRSAMRERRETMMGTASSTPAFHGNGEPIIGGKITSINGSVVTITNTNTVAYTINAASTTVYKRGLGNATLTDLAIGDKVIIQGTINGTSVVASSIHDQGVPPHNGTDTETKGQRNAFGGMMKGFFSRFFGFF